MSARILYPITFTCKKCRKDFHAMSSVQQDVNSITVIGLNCFDCAGQTELELDFSV